MMREVKKGYNHKVSSIKLEFFLYLCTRFSIKSGIKPTNRPWRFARRRTSSKNRIVGSGGKKMRVGKSILSLTKCKRYGNQED